MEITNWENAWEQLRVMNPERVRTFLRLAHSITKLSNMKIEQALVILLREIEKDKK